MIRFAYSVLFYIMLLVLIPNCTDNQFNKQYAYFSQNCTDLDSIEKFIDSNESKLPNNFSLAISSNLRQKGFLQKADSITEWFVRFYKDSKLDESRNAYLILSLSYMHLRKGDLLSVEKSINELEKCKAFKDHSDTVLVLNVFNLRGMLYYFEGNLDSAISFYEEGYQWALHYQRNREIEQFANNKGAIFYSMGRNETAIENFLVAYEYLLKRKGENPVLVNNIASILMSQYKLHEAEKYLKTCQKELNPKNLEYSGILIKLNYCRLLILKYRFEEARQIIKTFDIVNIPAVFKPDYYLNLLVIEQALSPQKTSEIITSNQKEFHAYRLDLLGKLSNGFPLEINKIPQMAQLIGYKISDIDSLILAQSPQFSQSVLWEILANQAAFEGDMQLHKKYITQSFNLLKSESNYIDSIRVLDVESKINHQKLQREYQNIQNEQKKNSRIILLQNIAIAVSLVLVMLAISFYVFRNKFIQQRQEFLKSQLESANQLADKLKTENELNAKITALSTLMVEQSQNISIRLGESRFSKDPVILQVKQDLERISKSQLENDQEIKRIESSHRYDFLWEFAQFAELSKTQRDILLLSIEGVKPIEIAQIMNVSYSHVRNMRSKLKRMMADIGISDFEELRKMERL